MPWLKPKLVKEYASPTLRKNKKSSLTLKNKTLQTHNPTDKNELSNDRKHKKQ